MNIMSWFEADGPDKIRRPDHLLIASVVLLTGWGLVTLYSSSYARAERIFENGYYFIIRQSIPVAVGILLFLWSSCINLQWFRKFIPWMVVVTLALCILTFSPLGIEKNGAKRWLGFIRNPANSLEPRISFQPSELLKISLPFYLAHIFSKKGDKINNFINGILPPALIIGFCCFIVYMQNNFSTTVFIALNSVIVFILAGVQLRWIFGAVILIIPLAGLMVLTETHRLVRVISFLRREEVDIQGAGYQLYSSIRAINSGGFWGKGLGQGTWKVAGIPEVHSDFIFSAFAEEAGLLGVILFVALFAFFAYRGYQGAFRNEDTFSRLLGYGLVTMIVTQTMLNLAVASGALPTTGLPLPFFSAGGTYLTMVLIMAGFIVNISRSSGTSGRGE
jgi:cell division protein FtsW